MLIRAQNLQLSSAAQRGLSAAQRLAAPESGGVEVGRDTVAIAGLRDHDREEHDELLAAVKELSRQGARFEVYTRSSFVKKVASGVHGAEQFMKGRHGYGFLKYYPARSREGMQVADPEQFKLFLSLHKEDDAVISGISQIYADNCRRRAQKPDELRRHLTRSFRALSQRPDFSDHKYTQVKQLEQLHKDLGSSFWTEGDFEPNMRALESLLALPEVSAETAAKSLGYVSRWAEKHDGDQEQGLNTLVRLAQKQPAALDELRQLYIEDDELYTAILTCGSESSDWQQVQSAARRHVLLTALPEESPVRASLADLTQRHGDVSDKLFGLRREDGELYGAVLKWLERHPDSVEGDWDVIWEQALREAVFGPDQPVEEIGFEEDFIVIGDVGIGRRN